MRGKALWFVLLTGAASVPSAAQEPGRQERAGLAVETAPGAAAAIATENREIERLYREGRYAEALERAAAVAKRAERELGSEHPVALASVYALAFLYYSQGRYAEAEPLYLRASAARERVLGAEHPDTIASINNLAALYTAQGRYAEAVPLYRRALTARERVLGTEHPDTLLNAISLAALYTFQDRDAEAEPLILRTLAASERVLGAEHPYTLYSVNSLAGVYKSQGRYVEAEALILRVLAARERALGAEHPDTLGSVNNLAVLYGLQGRYSEVEPLYLRALAASERALGIEHPDTILTVDNLAVFYTAHGRYAEAEPLVVRALAARERLLGIEHPDTLVSVNNLAALYYSQGRYAEAVPLYRRALAARERVFGTEHPDTIAATQNLAVAKLAVSDPEALGLADAALNLMRKRARFAEDSSAPSSAARAAGIDLTAFVYARAAWAAAERPPLDNPFEALQLIGATSVGRALARSAALATLDQAGQALALEREDALGQIEAVDSAFASAAGTDGGGAALTELLGRRTALCERLEAIDAALQASNPSYFALIRPQPVSLDALRKGKGAGSPLLRADEALVLLTPGDARFPEGQRRGFAFAVTREGAAWAELPLEPEALADLAGEVREGSAIIDPAFQQPVPRKRAKALYDALFGAPEIARLIGDKPSWIVSPQGKLLTTPFAALVTRDPQGDDGDPEAWATTAWLGVERALAILPEVNMVRALRGLDRPAGAASAPYFGIADPAFQGTGKGSEVRSAASYYRGAAGSPEAIIKLVPLPSTRTEAEAVARALGAGPEALLTGRAATEASLRAHASQLADARVIHFATHALVSGEMGGLTQPALALMPPTDTAGIVESNDGLLTAAEAATLKLNAEWVILSACNTAAGGGNGSEGLSGLARSFFFAGAASLLVSQWQVRDDSGAMLVAETVKAYAADESIGRAEALRRAMRAVIASQNANGESFAHPQDWAPFILVGVDR